MNTATTINTELTVGRTVTTNIGIIHDREFHDVKDSLGYNVGNIYVPRDSCGKVVATPNKFSSWFVVRFSAQAILGNGRTGEFDIRYLENELIPVDT